MKITIPVFIFGLSFLSLQQQSHAHCQVPCGIYNDNAVFSVLMTDVDTIEKAMESINDASTSKHQLARWVDNKEKHAQHIQKEASDYFLAQRIKLDEKKSNPEAYAKKIATLHEITVLAMKCKQTTDLENAKKLRAALENFKTLYMAK